MSHSCGSMLQQDRRGVLIAVPQGTPGRPGETGHPLDRCGTGLPGCIDSPNEKELMNRHPINGASPARDQGEQPTGCTFPGTNPMPDRAHGRAGQGRPRALTTYTIMAQKGDIR
jgi:hypothetical protein